MLSQVSIRYAQPSDTSACKRIADSNRDAVGFMMTVVFSEAVARGRLLVAEMDDAVAGFVRFNHRVRGTETALYDLCVDQDMRRCGVGRTLIDALVDECRASNRASIMLRCPDGLPANDFYRKLDFRFCGYEQGRRRALRVWRLNIEASMCNS